MNNVTFIVASVVTVLVLYVYDGPKVVALDQAQLSPPTLNQDQSMDLKFNPDFVASKIREDRKKSADDLSQADKTKLHTSASAI